VSYSIILVVGVLHAFMNARYQDPVREQFVSEDPAIVGLNPSAGLTGDPNTATVDTFLNSNGQTSFAYLNDPQELNNYSYGRDNPLRYTDPTGKEYIGYNAAFTVPFYGVPVGLTGGVFAIPNGYLPYIGVTTSVRPDLSWSITYSKNDASPGFAAGASELLPAGNSFVGPGGQVGFAQDQNGNYEPFGEYGIGKPGLPSASIYYAFNAASLARLINS
jgi:hypothetical protein